MPRRELYDRGVSPAIGVSLRTRAHQFPETCAFVPLLGQHGVLKKQRCDPELNEFAETALEFEVRILLCHAWAFLQRYPDGILGQGLADNVDDALLEGWLVHIRLLNDFLRHAQPGKHANAAAWERSWRSEGFLKPNDRDVLNDQLMHLAWKRKRWDEHSRPPWEGQIRGWTDACCAELLKFFQQVRDDLKPAFAVPRSYAEAWLLTGARPP